MTISPRRAREIARTRQDILEAAARAFVRNGFKAATMQDIAKEAGFTAASLYSYFASKEEIFTGLRRFIFEEMDSVFSMPFPAGLNFRQRLELLMRRHVQVTARRLDLFALLHVGGANSGDPKCFQHATSGFARRVELYTGFLREHASPEDLGGRDPVDVALAITGIGHAFFMHWLHDREAFSLEDRIPMILDLVFRGISGPAAA